MEPEGESHPLPEIPIDEPHFPLVVTKVQQEPETTPHRDEQKGCCTPSLSKVNCNTSRSTKIVFLTALCVFLTLSSLCIGIFALTKGASLYYIFSYVPYIIIFGLISLFGLPFPFSKSMEEEDMFYMDSMDMKMYKDIYHFCLSSIFPAPFAISFLILQTRKDGPIVSLIFVSHLLIIITSVIYLRIFFPSKVWKDYLEEDQDEDIELY